MLSFKRCLLWSLVLHVVVFIIGSTLSILPSKKNHEFVVFGAHSRYEAKTQYRPARLVPFVKHQAKRSGLRGRPGSKKGAAGKSVKKNKKTAPSKKVGKQKVKATASKKGALKPLKPAAKTTGKKNAAKSIPELDEQKKKTKPSKKKRPVKKEPPLPEPEQQEEAEVQPGTPPETANPEAQAPAQPEEASLETAAHEEVITEEGDGVEGFGVEGVYDPTLLAQFQRHVQEEIDRVWRPPLGVPRGTVCTVHFVVGKDGSVTSCTFAKRSSVLIYDLSIMRVASKLQFHESLWGKQFKIDFCQ